MSNQKSNLRTFGCKMLENIRSTGRTAKMVLLVLLADKTLLFMQMWHHLVVFFLKKKFLCWLRVWLTHLYTLYYFIGWEEGHFSSLPSVPNTFLRMRTSLQKLSGPSWCAFSWQALFFCCSLDLFNFFFFFKSFSSN